MSIFLIRDHPKFVDTVPAYADDDEVPPMTRNQLYALIALVLASWALVWIFIAMWPM